MDKLENEMKGYISIHYNCLPFIGWLIISNCQLENTDRMPINSSYSL